MLEVKEGFRVARFYIDGEYVRCLDEISYSDSDAFLRDVDELFNDYDNQGVPVYFTIGL